MNFGILRSQDNLRNSSESNVLGSMGAPGDVVVKPDAATVGTALCDEAWNSVPSRLWLSPPSNMDNQMQKRTE